jgi:hypothetical protein
METKKRSRGEFDEAASSPHSSLNAQPLQSMQPTKKARVDAPVSLPFHVGFYAESGGTRITSRIVALRNEETSTPVKMCVDAPPPPPPPLPPMGLILASAPSASTSTLRHHHALLHRPFLLDVSGGASNKKASASSQDGGGDGDFHMAASAAVWSGGYDHVPLIEYTGGGGGGDAMEL